VKRIFFILINVFLGLLFLYQFTAVFSQNLNRNIAVNDSLPVKIIDLGTLGGDTSQATDLNDAGEVVGRSNMSPGEGLYAFHWFAGEMTPLSGAEGEITNVYAIGQSGIAAGESLSAGSEPVSSPVLWFDNAYTPLPIGEDSQGSARAVNDSDIIAGNTLAETPNSILLWENNLLVGTFTLAKEQAQVHALNDRQQIVGSVHDGITNKAFVWQENVFEPLGTLGGQNSIAYDINENGEIVGEASLDEELATHAFLWQNGSMIDLGAIGDIANTTSRALGINEAGVIVGESQVGDAMHAVVWENGQIVDLNTLLPAESEWEMLISAVSINNNGWITGTGLKEGQEHAFLIQPGSFDFFSHLPVIAFMKPTPIPTATPTTTPLPSATPMPTSTPEPSPTPSTVGYDLARYMKGDGRLYEVRFKAGDFETQARHQTQFLGSHFYHTKGNEIKAEWEELWNDSYYIYRGTDTSPGNDLYYTLYNSLNDYLAGNPGSHWSERYMRVGDLYFRQPYVVFFNKSDCSVVAGGQYTDRSWLKFQAFHQSYTFDTGLILNNVVELAWMQGNENGPTQPVDERYFYAEGYGLVGWKKPSLGWGSAISEEHLPGARPDNVREEIGCLNSVRFTPQTWSPKLRTGPLPEPYASMVKP
jgi:probable HAF family extracellular repeat protein